MRLKGAPLPPKFPKVGGEIERTVLDNGMVIYLLEDHRLPLVDATVLVRTGTYYDSAAELRTALFGSLSAWIRAGTAGLPIFFKALRAG